MTCPPTKTYTCVSKRGCNDPQHVDGRRRYLRNVSKRTRLGQRWYVDGAPATRRIAAVLADGYTLADLAAASGISLARLSEHRDGGLRIHVKNLHALLSVSRADLGRVRNHVPNIGTLRRVDELLLRGIPVTLICERAGITPAALQLMRRRSSTCRRATAEAIARVYREWSDIDPAELGVSKGMSALVAKRAAAAGAIPAAAWDNIDDPAAVPDLGGTAYPNRRVHVEDVEWMVRSGAGRDEIAARIGVAWESVESACHRHGRTDLLRAVAAA